MRRSNEKVKSMDIEAAIKFHNEAMDKYALAHLRAGAEIEFMLRASIENNLINQVKLNKIIGDSLGRTIFLAFALGLIEQKTYEGLLVFKDVRNSIAHNTDPKIQMEDAMSMVSFLGKKADEEMENRGSCISEWHQAALDLLVKKVRSDVTD